MNHPFWGTPILGNLQVVAENIVHPVATTVKNYDCTSTVSHSKVKVTVRIAK